MNVEGGGATIWDLSAGVNNGYNKHTEDLTGTTGDYVIEIEVKSAAGDETITDLSIWSRDA